MISVIAGEGDLPEIVCLELKKLGLPFNVLKFDEKSNLNNLLDFRDLISFFKIGEIGRIFDFWKKNNVEKIVMCGKISFPGILNIKFDYIGLKFVSRFLGLSNKGDNSILTTVSKIIEENGFKVVSVQDAVPSILAVKEDEFHSTFFTNKSKYEDDISFGFNVLDKISDLDIGQAVVVQDSRVIAVEAAEGTDNMIKRSKDYILKSKKKPILVKTSKISQDRRFDMASIGPNTILNLSKSGFSGIAIRSGDVIIIGKDETREAAKKECIDIFVV